MGEVFAGRYELLDLIGQGGMGSVWRVHDRRTDEVVAAKVLRQSDAASLLRFVRETAFRVQHPHVVTPLGWAGEDDRVLFTMPVVDGGSVSTLVGDHGPLPPPFVAEILRQLLDALSAVHASRIVHRDVKPANILLVASGSERPHLYLTDFGIAVELDGPRLTETNVAIGTRGYMAPEQRRGELSTASDLYAVGALAGYMLTAAAPQPEPPATGERPDGVPESLWTLVTDLLSEDPDRRPDAEAALERLRAPELAWTPGAAEDVEVLRQIDHEEAPADDAATADRTMRTHLPGTVPMGPSSPGTTPMVAGPPMDTAPPAADEGGARPAPPRRARRWLLPAGIVGAVLVVAVAALVLAWSAWSGPEGGESPTSDGPVGAVVGDVGDSCEFSEVGLRGETEGGEPVVCARGDDGAYSWESTDS